MNNCKTEIYDLLSNEKNEVLKKNLRFR